MSRNSKYALTLLASSFIFALVLAEVILRVLPNSEQSLSKHREVEGDSLHQRDPLLGWRTRPHASAIVYSPEYKISVHNNSRGIRGPEYSYKPRADELRVLIIGDSFTAGYTVQFEETFGQLLERRLNDGSSFPYTVISAGTEAYSTDQEFLFFVGEGRKYRPDVTVLMFFFNDIWFNTQPVYGGGDFQSKPLFRLDERRKPVLAYKPNSTSNEATTTPATSPTKKDSEGVTATLATKRWLNEHSHLYRLVRRITKNDFRITPIPLRDVWFQYPLLDQYRVFQVSYDEDIRMAWDLTEALIVELARQAASKGSLFLLFHIPPRESVYDDVWHKALAYHSLRDGEWQADRVELQLGIICSKHNLDCILPTARFRDKAQEISPKRLYLVADPHWSPEGHQLAGLLLAEHIRSKMTRPRRSLNASMKPAPTAAAPLPAR
jgi:hypothetical protein